MTAPRTRPARTPRTARIAAATAGLGIAALAVAPTALADGYQHVAPMPSTSSVPARPVPAQPAPPVTGTTSHTTSHTASHQVTPARATTAHRSALAHTGFEAGGVAAVGLGLVVVGAALVRGGRRRADASA